MTSTITEENAAAPAPAAGEQPKASKKASRAPRRAPVTPAKGKAGKKASPAKKAPKGAKESRRHPRNGSKTKEKRVRKGSKTETILELLKRPGGATAKELIKATSWQPHSLRGFISGTLGKKMGLAVTSTKGEDGERTYAVKA